MLRTYFIAIVFLLISFHTQAQNSAIASKYQYWLKKAQNDISELANSSRPFGLYFNDSCKFQSKQVMYFLQLFPHHLFSYEYILSDEQRNSFNQALYNILKSLSFYSLTKSLNNLAVSNPILTVQIVEKLRDNDTEIRCSSIGNALGIYMARSSNGFYSEQLLKDSVTINYLKVATASLVIKVFFKNKTLRITKKDLNSPLANLLNLKGHEVYKLRNELSIENSLNVAHEFLNVSHYRFDPKMAIQKLPQFLWVEQTLIHELLHKAHVDNFSTQEHNKPYENGRYLLDSVYSCAQVATKKINKGPKGEKFSIKQKKALACSVCASTHVNQFLFDHSLSNQLDRPTINYQYQQCLNSFQ